MPSASKVDRVSPLRLSLVEKEFLRVATQAASNTPEPQHPLHRVCGGGPEIHPAQIEEARQKV